MVIILVNSKNIKYQRDLQSISQQLKEKKILLRAYLKVYELIILIMLIVLKFMILKNYLNINLLEFLLEILLIKIFIFLKAKKMRKNTNKNGKKSKILIIEYMG